ncbi:[Fe-Fe] hydrogenase large subunit C-terminal domain-containing protein [Butyrivibrio sp. MC2013]|uniref:[Fe-Fe] hydrogenase large subunit C-terminal domain-containing protein n=1 Tax=Butyrivibrio sp. MC2013 TaxID=1280686 RepID=UPI0003F75F9D|nr:[Fe-Fe] hydrogenase large subunit C-terminal domain-containing protein [Butyrivibrio sp. MC2013]
MSSCLTLKKSNCKNCYKCIRSCPVKSIRFSANQAHIIDNECILCGTCFVVCPQNAKRIVDDTEKVQTLIRGGERVIASVAPSFIANYPGCGIASLRKALMKLGFADASETSVGATVVKKEYDRILVEEDRDIVISSCCHSVNLLIQKYYPDCLPYLADVLSPMQAHSMLIKKEDPSVKTVFIGPCVSKKDEAASYGGYVDVVLTFEELTGWLKAEGIELEPEMDSEKESRARLFPTSGGILNTMEKTAPDYTYLAIDGVENCIAALKDIQEGKVHKCFIEMSSCAGSCINGPVMEKNRRNPISDYRAVTMYAGRDDFDVPHTAISEVRKEMLPIRQTAEMPNDFEIADILKKMGKNKPSDELNCGSCGYNTCREKAIAIYQGKADISMCLPFLKDKAESFSDTIVKNTPNGLIVLNDTLEVQQINQSACKILNIPYASDIIGEPIVRVLDPTPFFKVQTDDKIHFSERTYLAEYGKYVEETIVQDQDSKMLICIITDVTKEEKEHLRKEEISRETVEVADKVVDKQMRIVQEIAYLLGETAAETKIALSKLKESISDE